MDQIVLVHHGIKGMKWGIRRTQAQLGHTTGKNKKKMFGKSDEEVRKARTSAKSSQKQSQSKETKKTSSRKSKKKVSEMSEEELQSEIRRLELEKRYSDLMKSNAPKKEGQEFVKRVLSRSAENIATQFVTYAFGTALNKAVKNVYNDSRVVNPKKGQKDK